MTLLSGRADDLRTLLDPADPGAVWAVGGPEGTDGGSAGGSGGGSGSESGAADRDLDVGGLAAVLAVWPVIGALVDEGSLRLHTPLASYGPEAADGLPAATTAHHLLTHAEGPAVLALTRLAEHLGQAPLAELAATRVWGPLGMDRTRFADGTLCAPLADLTRFPRHLLSPVDADPPGITRSWTAESLRIRTGELTPARGLLWHPAPHGVWGHHAREGGPGMWLSPRRGRWAVLVPDRGQDSLRTAFREAAFAPTPLS
ncbi:hypothetical protein ACWFQ8_20205 [Streptomyces sp. NPDC055254]